MLKFKIVNRRKGTIEIVKENKLNEYIEENCEEYLFDAYLDKLYGSYVIEGMSCSASVIFSTIFPEEYKKKEKEYYRQITEDIIYEANKYGNFCSDRGKLHIIVDSIDSKN